MWLVDLYHEVDFTGFLIAVAVALGLLLTIVVIILVNIMHLILSARLDPVLFNERWFSPAERGMFLAWPLSLMKTGIYMALIGFPKYMLKTKRFKEYDLDLSFSMPIVIASRTYIFLIFSIVFLGLLFAVLVLYTFVEAEFL